MKQVHPLQALNQRRAQGQKPTNVPILNQSKPPRLVAGMPSYDGTRRNSGTYASLLTLSIPTLVVEVSSSLLCNTFNRCWIEARKAYTRLDATHFLMVHADITPQHPQWLQIMFQEMERHQADVLSAVVPIKNDQGLSSTGVDTNEWRPKRYSMAEIAEKPVTWTEPGLLVNTGLMLVKLGAWVDQIHFHMEDKIQLNDNGEWEAYTKPEDWNFSRDCTALGLRIFATRAVPLLHWGTQGYSNQAVWGKPADDECAPIPQVETQPVE